MFHLVLIAGGSCSGKTTLCELISNSKQLGNRVAPISMDNFYKDLSHFTPEQHSKHNFDHPDAIDFELIENCVSSLLAGEAFEIPTYDFETHSRISSKRIKPQDFIILEGLFPFYSDFLVENASIKIYVKCEADIRLARRVLRDIETRGRTAESVVGQYLNTVRPMHARFIEPDSAKANIVIDGESCFDAILDEIIRDIDNLNK